MPRQSLFAAAVLLAILIPAAAIDPDKKTQDQDIPAAMKPYAEKLLEVAKGYERFGRVDDEYRWAPYLCREPNPGRAAFSASKDDDTHGRKLYSLFAKDHKAYAALKFAAKDSKPAPVGQVIVKESWLPEEAKVDGATQPTIRKTGGPGHEGIDVFFPYAQREGKWYKAAKKAGLFVMMKFEPKTEGTDDGWVYGTVSADLKRVTSVGKVASCMECHQKAKFDRLFGPAPKR